MIEDRIRFAAFFGGLSLGAFFSATSLAAQSNLPISVTTTVPSELNGANGAPNATPEQAARFAWQEFIALNWPAGPQEGRAGQRKEASTIYPFGDPSYTGPTVWETFRSKVEIFPGQGNPPGYASNDALFGFDTLPRYNYQSTITACDAGQGADPPPWINLDEIDQITLNKMYAGIVDPTSSLGNSAPQLIRFLAKANRAEYVYVTEDSSPTDGNKQWWSMIPSNVVKNTRDFLTQHQASPPSGSSKYVSLPDHTIEIKAAWRPLNPSELASGRFHVQWVRFYEKPGATHSLCYHDAVWGLIALHIIQKTPSAPYFIYASFEQADNLLTAEGKPVEDNDGNVMLPAPTTATTPEVCLILS